MITEVSDKPNNNHNNTEHGEYAVNMIENGLFATNWGGQSSYINQQDNLHLKLFHGLVLLLLSSVPKRNLMHNKTSSKIGNWKGLLLLPLPVHTGLPVHINGYFELSSNRRDIWSGRTWLGTIALPLNGTNACCA